MNRPLKISIGRIFAVTVLMAAWFAMSNQCAFAVMAPGSASEVHKCCAGGTAGTQGQAPQNQTGPCCKALRLLPGDAGAKLVKAPDSIELISWAWAALAQILRAPEPHAVARPRGLPPDAPSFAEAVLQGSLPVHAPPIAA